LSTAATNDGIATRETTTYDWASFASTPIVNTANRFAVFQMTDKYNEGSNNNQGNQRFTIVSSRRSKCSLEQPNGVDQSTRPTTQQPCCVPPVVCQSITRTKVTDVQMMKLLLAIHHDSD